MTADLAHLVFSTRGRHPTGGPDAVREVIAASPGVPEAARRELADRADLGGSLLHAELDGPVYAFSPIDEASWLFCRAVSLGRYRKGAHQLLVHGVVLGPEHLAAVAGNPLLLDRGEGRLAFLAEHPGAGAVLPPLAFPALAAADARAANRRRFAELAARLGDDDAWLAAAWGAVGRGERVALVDPRPRAELAEWLLLHLHPDDRPLVAFHTWYSHGRPLDYRLLVTAPEEAARVRAQFRGLALIETAAPPAGGPGEAGELARRLRRRDPDAFLRVLDEVHLTRLAGRPLPPLDEADAALALGAALAGEAALDGAGRERLALLRLRAEPAAVLRYAIGDLAAAWRRGPRDFARTLAPLAESVEVEPAAVAAVATALAGGEGGEKGGEEGGDDALRWSLLALLDAADRRRPGRGLAAERVPTWRRLVPRGGGFEALVRGFDAGRAEAAEGVLVSFVLAAAQAELAAAGAAAVGRADSAAEAGIAGAAAHSEVTAAGATGAGLSAPGAAGPVSGGADRGGAAPGVLDRPVGGAFHADRLADPDRADWPALLAWLARRGRPTGEVAARIERLAIDAPPDAGVAWLRRLGRAHAEAGHGEEALRVWLDAEAPRLAGEERRRRVEEVVGWALDQEVDGIDAYLDHPALGDAVPAALVAWAEAQPDPDAAWRRLDGLLAGWRLDAGAAPAVGALLGRLAASPLAGRVPEAVSTLARPFAAGPLARFLGGALAAAARQLAPAAAAAAAPGELRRTVAGAAELLQVRNRHPGATSGDGALLALALPALVAAQELAAAGDERGRAAARRFRDAWAALLTSRAARGLDGGALDGLDAAAREDWLDLLLDDLRREPLRAPEDDPRYGFLLTLAWRAWAAEPTTRHRLRLHRALGLPAVAPEPAWQRRRIAAAVPPDLVAEAQRLAALPATAGDDNLPAGTLR